MVKSDPNKRETDASSFQGSSVAGTKFEPFGPGAWVSERQANTPPHPPHFPLPSTAPFGPRTLPRRCGLSSLADPRPPNGIPLVFLRVGVVDIFITSLVITAGPGPLP